MSLLNSKALWAGVAALTGIALYRAQRPGVMTPERDATYRRALNGQVRDTAQLRALADAFQKARLFPQAHLLRQRADLRDLPPEVKAQRKEIYRKGMRSKNKSAVMRLADAFDSQGANTCAFRLRQYASGLPDIDGASFAPIITPEPTDGEGEGGTGEGGDGPAERHDTEPAPAEERPLKTPEPPHGDPIDPPSRPETPPGPPQSLNGLASNGAAHA